MDFSCKISELDSLNNEQLETHLSSEEHVIEDDGKKSDSTEDIYCVFCCKLFDSIEKVELHVSEEHAVEEPENNNFLTGNMSYEIKLEPTRMPEEPERQFIKPYENKVYSNGFPILTNKLTVYDVDLNVIQVDGTKLDQIKFCVRCNRHFDGEDNLRQHQLKDHAIRKRKRSTHPNGVEGIVVTGDGRWSCDVCGREFPTLKQAKVHKFKSHIEPIQKQEMLSHDFTIRNIPGKDSGNEGTQFNNYYLQVIPNIQNNASNTINIVTNTENNAPSTEISIPNIEIKVPKTDSGEIIPKSENKTPPHSPEVPEDSTNQISSNSELRLDQYQSTVESDSEKNYAVDLSQPSSPKNLSNLNCETVWKIKSLDPEDTKISLSKIPLKFDQQKPDITGTNEPHSFSTMHYVCPHCQASFGSRAVYSRHILVHRRGKAFACDKCGMAFTRNHTLKQHKDTKCVISNPIVGVNCQANDQCIKCGVYFASSNSHISHCKKVCKISVNSLINDESSSRDSVKSEETNAQYESQLEIDVGENEIPTPVIINDFIDNPAFVTKKVNEFTCNLCCCYFASYKSIGQHLEQYHRIVVRSNLPIKPIIDNEKMINIQNSIRTFAPKEDMMKQPHQTYISPKIINISKVPQIEPAAPKILEKPIKMEPKESPPQKLLIPSNFSLQKLVPMYSFEAVNLSTNQSVSNISPISQISPMIYKNQLAKKCKVPPNANGEFECKECHKTFGCRSSLSNHVKSHFNLKNKPFSCEDCKQGFMSQISYQEHRKSQCPKLYGEKASESSTSYSSPSVVYNLAGTSPTSAPGRATCCMHCNAAFPDRSLLEDHAAKEHSNENGEVICLMCTRSFTTYMAFRVHMTKSHGGPNGTPLKSHLISSVSVSNSQIKKTLPHSPISSFPEFPYSNFHLNHFFSPVTQQTCQTCKMDFGNAQALETHKKVCSSPIFSESNASKDQLII